MRKYLLLLVGVPLATGCVDATGILNDCSVDMARVLDQHGPYDEQQDGEAGGDRFEVWYYDASRTKYEFRWGPSYDGCQVTRGSFSVLPLPRELLRLRID